MDTVHEEPRAGLRARAPARGARRRGEGPQARRGGVRQEEEGGVGYGAGLRPRGTALHHFSGRDINQPYGHKASPALCSLVNFSERFGIPISANPVNYVSN